MARAKKAVEPQPKPEPVQRIGLVENSLHQKWIEPMPVKSETSNTPFTPQPMGTPQAPQENQVTVIEELPDFYEDEPEHTYDELMSELTAGGETLTCHVTSFPNYHVDHNGSTAHADTEVAGSFTIPPSVRNRDDLIRLAQEKYATPDKPFHHFMLTVRGRRIKRNLPIVRVKSVGYADRATAPQSETNYAIPATMKPIDPLDALKKQAEAFREIKKIFSDDRPRQEQVIPAGQPLTTEAAILKLISDDPEQVSAIAARFLPVQNGNSNGNNEWFEMLKPLIPLAASWLMSRMQQPDSSPQPASNGAGQNVTAPAPAGAPNVPATPPEYLKMREILGRIVYGIRNGFQPDFIAEEIDMLCEKDAALNQICTEFFSQRIPQIQAGIAANLPPAATPIINSPEAAQWLTEMLHWFSGETAAETGEVEA